MMKYSTAAILGAVAFGAAASTAAPAFALPVASIAAEAPVTTRQQVRSDDGYDHRHGDRHHRGRRHGYDHGDRNHHGYDGRRRGDHPVGRLLHQL